MTKKQERHIVATIGTILFLLLVFLLLWFIRLRTVVPEEEEGIELIYGEVVEAGGAPEDVTEEAPVSESEASVPAQPAVSAPELPSAPSDNDLLTQEEEAELALRKEQEEAERKRKQKEAEARERQRQQEQARIEADRKAREEQARLEAEQKAREEELARQEAERKAKAEAERKAREAKEQAAREKAEAMGNLFGNQGNTSGSGDQQGEGQKGNPVGHGTSGGNDWTLEGRSVKGDLPRPKNTFNQEGKVIVQIRVNAEGKVTEAKVKGGNISDKATTQLALDAAYKAQFSEGDHDQFGTITYNFKFN